MMLIIKKELELKKQKRFMCFNNSKQKMKWDLFVMLCACWNCFQIPINVAFPGSVIDNIFTDIMNSFIDIFFFIDIIVNFRTTYMNTKTAEEITAPQQIAMNYLKTRFIIDFLATIPFDLIGGFIFSSEEDAQLL